MVVCEMAGGREKLPVIISCVTKYTRGNFTVKDFQSLLRQTRGQKDDSVGKCESCTNMDWVWFQEVEAM